MARLFAAPRVGGVRRVSGRRGRDGFSGANGGGLCDDCQMDFSLERSNAVLIRTPDTLRSLLLDLPDDWTMSNEGPGTWSPYQTLGHMAHIEESDWMDRTVTMLAEGGPHHFEPVDREAGFARYEGWSVAELLEHFGALRKSNLEQLAALVTNGDLENLGIHPTFGEVRLRQLLAAWVVHDLNHLDQIVKTMAKQYGQAVGPWREFLPIVDAP
jgi:DinB family protein